MTPRHASPPRAARPPAQAELSLLPADPERERRRLRAIFEEAPALLMILRGRALVLEACTPAAQRLFGRRLVPGVSLVETTPELRAQGFFDLMWRVYDTGEPFHASEHPAAIDRTGGGELEMGYFDLVYHATRDADGLVDGILMLGVDVTAEVEARRQLERAMSARDEFLAAASHELGTPLAIIELALEGFRRALREQGVDLGERARRHLERTRRATRRLGRVRDSMVETSRQRAGSLALQPREIDLGELVRTVSDDVVDLAGGSGCALSVHVEDRLPARLDAERVAHALSCVLENAIKFGAGRPIELNARRAGADARIEVVDQGAGISPEHVVRIFEPFERASSARHYGGLGVGLSTASEIIDASGGDISVRSRPGAGATFVIRLPLSA
jgi:signal transduction histidine kinase